MKAEKAEEVDFVLIDGFEEEGKKMIQASYRLDLVSTREREIRALVKIGKKLKLQQADIITFDMEGEEDVTWFDHPLHFRMIPAWKYFLSTKAFH